jgi:Leucine-rich repeat (LRR) protein
MYSSLPLDKVLYECEQYKTTKLELYSYKLITIPTKLKEFTWVTSLDVSMNELTELENLPPNLEELSCSHNNLSSINDIDLPDTLTSMNLSHNNLSEINKLPLQLENLICNDCGMDSISNIPNSVIHIELNNNILNELPDLPTDLEYLSVENNMIKELPPSYPDGLEILNISYNQIKEIKNLPDNLHTLDASNNMIKLIDVLPNSLVMLKTPKNYLTRLPELPLGLVFIDVSYNHIEDMFTLCEFSDDLMKLDCSNNRISYIPEHIYNLNIDLKLDDNVGYNNPSSNEYETLSFTPLFNDLDNYEDDIKLTFGQPTDYSDGYKYKPSFDSPDRNNPHYIINTKHCTL